MIEVDGKMLDINLKEDDNGRDRVVLKLQTGGCDLSLTPHQARVLATELIMAVNRAEVRGNLKHSHSLTRNSHTTSYRRDLFNQSFS